MSNTPNADAASGGPAIPGHCEPDVEQAHDAAQGTQTPRLVGGLVLQCQASGRSGNQTDSGRDVQSDEGCYDGTTDDDNEWDSLVDRAVQDFRNMPDDKLAQEIIEVMKEHDYKLSVNEVSCIMTERRIREYQKTLPPVTPFQDVQPDDDI
jgi:hypothetical protein